jgi:hypothetical protein
MQPQRAVVSYAASVVHLCLTHFELTLSWTGGHVLRPARLLRHIVLALPSNSQSPGANGCDHKSVGRSSGDWRMQPMMPEGVDLA